MLRTCPTCADYYDDDSLAFCLADGTPLADVDPQSDDWGEGMRVVEEKAAALLRRKRRLKWRRILMSTLTMLMTTIIVCVVAVNSLIYLKPKTEPAVINSSEPEPSPPSVSTPEETPTPTPTPECSVADKRAARESIFSRYGDVWRRAIMRERAAIVAEHVPVETTPTDTRISEGRAELSSIAYDVTFSKTCATASVSARYAWQVAWTVSVRDLARTESKPVTRKKSFVCTKRVGAWRCG